MQIGKEFSEAVELQLYPVQSAIKLFAVIDSNFFPHFNFLFSLCFSYTRTTKENHAETVHSAVVHFEHFGVQGF